MRANLGVVACLRARFRTRVGMSGFWIKQVPSRMSSRCFQKAVLLSLCSTPWCGAYTPIMAASPLQKETLASIVVTWLSQYVVGVDCGYIAFPICGAR